MQLKLGGLEYKLVRTHDGRTVSKDRILNNLALIDASRKAFIKEIGRNKGRVSKELREIHNLHNIRYINNIIKALDDMI